MLSQKWIMCKNLTPRPQIENLLDRKVKENPCYVALEFASVS